MFLHLSKDQCSDWRIQGESALLLNLRQSAEAEATAMQAANDRIATVLEHSETDLQSIEHLHIIDNVAFDEDDDWEDEDDYVGPKVVP